MADFSLHSPEFEEGQMIPAEFTCEGDNMSPGLEIKNTPEGTMSLAITVDDPDIPEAVKEQMGIEIFNHWVAYNLPPSTETLEAGDTTGTQGSNSAGTLGYTGPCPPADKEPKNHRYFFRVYALDTTLELPEGATKQELKNAMADHVLARTELVGRYEMQE